MLHERQRLAFCFKPSDDFLRIHSRLDDLDRNLPLHGLGLLCDIDYAHATFADLLTDLVRTYFHWHIGMNPVTDLVARWGNRWNFEKLRIFL